jgi:hypothetical protein
MARILESFSPKIRFDTKDLVGNVTPQLTVEEVVAAIEEKSGKKFRHKVIHADVVQMVGNIFNFFDYSREKLSSDLVSASVYAKRMKK